MRLSILYSIIIVFLTSGICSCGTRQKLKQSEFIKIDAKSNQSIDFSVIDSMKSVLMNLFIRQEFEEFEPLRDSSGQFVKDRAGNVETYRRFHGRTDFNQQHTSVDRATKANIKADNSAEINAKVKATTKEKESDTTVKNNLPWQLWTGILILFFIGLIGLFLKFMRKRETKTS